ncbi:acyl carrier protein [bacterium]|nr:acyl carrier protein [bacterium]
MTIENEVKELIIKALELEDIEPSDIEDEAPLFIEGLGLDSIDALELGMALKKKYNLKMGSDKEENKKYFYSVKTLADYIRSNVGE